MTVELLSCDWHGRRGGVLQEEVGMQGTLGTGHGSGEWIPKACNPDLRLMAAAKAWAAPAPTPGERPLQTPEG